MATSLSSVSRNAAIRPPRTLLYSSHGLGKTTFGASAPNPVFILTEDGLGSLDVAHFPLASSYQDVVDAITALYSEPHEFSTVVLDSLDWLDTLIWADVNGKHDAKDLAYGKGAVVAASYWKTILDGLNALRLERGMAIVLLAHCQVKRFDSPEVEPFDRYQPKLQERSSALVQEWCDAVFFANYKLAVAKTDVGFNQKVSRGISTGERVMYTEERPAYYAKNRYGLPHELPLSWNAFAAAVAATVPTGTAQAPNPAAQAA